jgi:hypothetical protein
MFCAISRLVFYFFLLMTLSVFTSYCALAGPVASREATFNLLFQNYLPLISKRKLDVLYFQDSNTHSMDIVLCGGSIVYLAIPPLPSQKKNADKINRAAFARAILNVGLRRAGYPASVWEHDVDNIARSILTTGDASSAVLVSNLNRYRKAHNDLHNLPVATELGECGGVGGTEVSFVPAQPGDQIWIIPEFWYQVCGKLRSNGVNPDSPETCDSWI